MSGWATSISRPTRLLPPDIEREFVNARAGNGARVNIDLSLRYDQRTTFVSILSPSLLLLFTLLSLLLSRFTGTPGEPSSPSTRTRAGRLAYSVDLHADLIRVHAHSARPSPLKRGLGRGRGRRRRRRGRRSVEPLLPLSVSFREDYYRRKLGGVQGGSS